MIILQSGTLEGFLKTPPAAKWHINPNKIGVIGFSAEGFMIADISTHFEKRVYSPIDAADKKSCRPDFAIALYPGHTRRKVKVLF